MDGKMRKLFPWFHVIKSRFSESLINDYELDILEKLQWNVTREIRKLEKNFEAKRAKVLLDCIEFFYLHFCKVWRYRKEVCPDFLAFSSPMTAAWIHTLASFVEVCLIRSNCMQEVLVAIMRFPGDKDLVYSALLALSRLKTQYLPTYEEILRHVVINPLPSFVPVRIDDPVKFLKMHLLVRRLKLRTTDPAVVAKLIMRASKVLAPGSLRSWLMTHNFSVPWSKKGIKKVNLATDISRELKGDLSKKEVVKALREILIPDINTKTTKVLSRKRARKCAKNSSQDDAKRNATLDNPEVQDSVGESEDKFDSNNYEPGWSMALYAKRNATLDNLEVQDSVGESEDKFDSNNCEPGWSDDANLKTKKSKKRKSIYFEENHSCKTGHSDEFFHENDSESIELVTEKERKQKLKHVAGKIQDSANNEYYCLLSDGARKQKKNKKSRNKKNVVETMLDKDNDKYSCLLNDGERKQIGNKKSKKDQSCLMDSSDLQSEPRRKKRKREKVIAEKSAEKVNATFGDHSLISETVKIKRKKAKKLGTNSEEINVVGSVSKEKRKLSESMIVDCTSSCSDDNRPVKKVKNFLSCDSNSGRKKRKDTKTKLNLGTEAKTVDEDIFTIDSEPSSCSSEPDFQIKYETVYNGELTAASPFGNFISLNSSVNLRNDLPTKFSSRLKTTSNSHTPEETEGSDVSSCQKSESFSDDLNLKDNLFSKLKTTDSRTSKEIQSSCEKSKNISGDLNSPVDLKDDLPAGSNSKSKIDGCQSSLETLSSSDQQEQVSEKEIGTLSDCQTDINVTSSAMEEYSTSPPENVESSQDSAVQTGGNDCSSAVLCVVEKEKTAQKNRVSQPSTDSPLKTDKTLQNLDVKMSSLRENLELEENKCSFKIKEEPLLEQSVPSLPENQVPQQSVPLTTNIASEVVVTKEKLMEDSNMANKIKYEMDFDSSESFEVDNTEVKKETDDADIDVQSLSQNNPEIKKEIDDADNDVQSLSQNYPEIKKETDNADIDVHSLSQNTCIDDCQTSRVFDVKSPVIKTESELEDSEAVTSCKILNNDAMPNDVDKTPNISAVKKIVKLEKDCSEEESIKQNMKGDLTSTPSQSSAFLVKLTSPNDKSPQPSFFNISAENVNKNKGLLSPTTEFLQYRDLSNSQADSGSEGSLSERRSIVKTEPSECPSDASHDTEGEETNSSSDCSSRGTSNSKRSCETYVVKTEPSWDDAITRERFRSVDDDDMSSESSLSETDEETDLTSRKRLCKEEYSDGNEMKHSLDNQVHNSTKVMPLQGLNPVVNLGERCDSKNFIRMDSRVSADSLNLPSVPSPVEQWLTQLDETANNMHADASNMETNEKTDKVRNDVKMQVQLGHTERCEVSDQLTVSGEDQEPFELKREKEITRHLEATVYDKGQELAETRQNSEHSLGMQLRKRHVPAVQKSLPVNETSSELKQDIPATQHMSLRSRNPSSSSSQEKFSPAHDGSDELKQDIPATQHMSLRNRNPSSSSQQKSSPVHDGSDELKQDIPVTQRVHLRSRNPSSSTQGKSSVEHSGSSEVSQNIPATQRLNLRSKIPTTSSRKVVKRTSQTVANRSSKRLKKEVNLNLGLNFSELSLNSPKCLRSRPNDSSNRSCPKDPKDDIDSSTSDQGNPQRRVTRGTVITSTADQSKKEQDADGYNLRSRKPVIMPGKLKL